MMHCWLSNFEDPPFDIRLASVPISGISEILSQLQHWFYRID